MKDATLLFLVQDDQVLLAMKKRGFGAGRWNGVGGKVNDGESIEEATIRETQEEIGVQVLHIEKYADLTFKNEEVEGQNMHVHVFVCRDWEGQPEESEEMAPEWFYMDMIPYDKMWSDDQYWLPEVLAGHGVSAEFTFDADDQIIRHTLDIVEPERLI